MYRRRLLCRLTCMALILPIRTIAAVSPGDLPVVPVVQLTVQPPRFLLARKSCVGNALLRELQRQAVLIAARDELGLGTRDMALREPFAPHGASGVTTVLIETRIARNQMAQICLARFDGNQPKDPYALADLQVDQSQNTCQQWAGFAIKRDPLVNYLEFVAQCEKASRTSYLDALRAEKILGDFQPRPIHWASGDAPADAQALKYLRRMDVFSQYLAIRQLHAQIARDGASVDRLSALVRGYANLGQLTSNQCSQADKVFFARSLLYAERLVVHENSSPASLYVRAYSRAFAGLHAAALSDLDAAGKQNAPPWADLVAGLCRYDPAIIEQALATGPWQYRQLATFLAAVVADDDFPAAFEQDAVNRALGNYPGMFALALLSTDAGDAATPRPSDQVVNAVPVLMEDALKEYPLPHAVRQAVGWLTPGDDSYQQVASVRDRLDAAALRVPCETAEPSLGVLADLIEQQEMVGVIHKAQTLHNNGSAGSDGAKFVSSVQPILKVHPWGPYVEALMIDQSTDAEGFRKKLSEIKDNTPGVWVEEAMDELGLSDTDSNSEPAQPWAKAANLSADSLVDDYTPATASAKAINHDLVRYLSLMQKTSPHSATLMEAWLRAMPAHRVERDKPMYEQAMARVQTEFADRPAVMLAACDWCEQRGDFQRSLNLLQRIDSIEPNGEVCERLAKTVRHLGRHEEAIADLMRGITLASGPSPDNGSLYQRAACYLIDDGRYDDALAAIQMSADAPTPRVWQLMARCYEAAGRLEDADECLRQQALADPAASVQYYLWARRLDRRDANGIRCKAAAAVAQPGDSIEPAFYLNLADDREARAVDVLTKNFDKLSDAFDFAQVMILAKKQGNSALFSRATAAMKTRNLSNFEFGDQLKLLAAAADLPAGMSVFDDWANRQLDDENAVDWYSLAGRYLVAAGHVAEGKAYLARAVRCTPRERENYYLAWRELKKMGEDPRRL
jgi:tetratricopeptide (TPR) repeat protein